MVKQLKLGILGFSEGNGHPYSWSAIFNGYRKKFMKNCPFPLIPAYLAKQKFPKASIKRARVTHIWTQDKSISKHIAKSSRIDNIVKDYEEMIGKVDGILLARDDSKNHKKLATPFIKAGKPIYIDKPISINLKQLRYFKNIEQYKNQIFTCSALRYAKEFKLKNVDKKKIGKIEYIDAYTMKSWEKYAIHIIDSVVKNYLYTNKIKRMKKTKIGDKTQLSVLWNNRVITRFNTFKKTKTPLRVVIYGSRGFKEIIFKDTFFAFKSALNEFIKICFEKSENKYSYNYLEKVVKIIQEGMK